MVQWRCGAAHWRRRGLIGVACRNLRLACGAMAFAFSSLADSAAVLKLAPRSLMPCNADCESRRLTWLPRAGILEPGAGILEPHGDPGESRAAHLGAVQSYVKQIETRIVLKDGKQLAR